MSQGDSRPGQPFLRVDSLTSGYRQVPIVHDVTLEVHRGELACIVGPNGSGKSNILKAIAGLLPPFSGTVTLDSRDVTGCKTPELVRAGMGYVPQVDDVFPPLTVEENLEVGGYCLDARRIAERKDAVLELFPRLTTMLQRHAGRLSGGERKMVAMARVLMLEPSLLLLDEPTAGLSEELATRMLGTQLRQLTDAGTAVLLVEQRAALAIETSDWAYVMGSGSVRYSASTAEIGADSSFGHVFLGGAHSPEAESDPALDL